MRAALAVASGLCACGSSGATTVFDFGDAKGDVRLKVPRHAEVSVATFDLEHVTLTQTAAGYELVATFANPVPTLGEVRAARDHVVSMVPMTLDVYLDIDAGTGGGKSHVKALPGRGFRVPAAEAWEQVLVVSSLDDLTEDGVVHATHVTARGRRLTAVFPKDALKGDVKGVLVVVLATSTSGDGRVRPVALATGDCEVWDDSRCTLGGRGPAVLDAVGEVSEDRPLAMTYLHGERPKALAAKVVFARGPLVGVAPVGKDVVKGLLATLYDATGAAIATAAVVSVIGDTATLEVIGMTPGDSAVSVEFAAPGAN